MRCRLALLGWVAVIAGGCTMANPEFDSTIETEGRVETDSTTIADESDTATDATELPTDSSEEEPPVCELSPGMDMSIKVPQPCGETNDVLGTYEHWFSVIAGQGSTWTVQFCQPGCMECEPLAQELEFSPLPVTELAAAGSCLLMSARRLGSGDDCNYHTVTVQDMNAAGKVLIVARRTELLDLPELESNTGLLGFEPAMIVDETCECLASDDCCDGQGQTLYSYMVNDIAIAVGESKQVSISQRDYMFWAFDGYFSGVCGTGTNVVWALTAK